MKIKNRLWKDGKKCCLTFSFDDGRKHDYRLVDIFNKNGMKGTFNLNSGFMRDNGNHVMTKDVATLYTGHEVAVHSHTHPTLTELPSTIIIEEIMRDKQLLEQWWGHTVRGMAYPNGPFDQRIANLCRDCGMNYARTGASTSKFRLPEDFMFFHPTCNEFTEPDTLMKLWEDFVNIPVFRLNMPLFYMYGHSYNFEDWNMWDKIETFCKNAGGHPDVWYATNIEVFDYVRAQRMVDYAIDKNMAYNPSAISVWIDVDGKPIELKPGENKF
ncbi:MAG: polysaccharide deacetylase family protein [Clostridia bacterium]|nr:polysaccharide deacetylase family protein [Clostridia bacterium]